MTQMQHLLCDDQTSALSLADHTHHHHPDPHVLIDPNNPPAMPEIPPSIDIEKMMQESGLSESALAIQNSLGMGFQDLESLKELIPGQNFPRSTAKRRKPVKWEAWEESNLMAGVRRVLSYHLFFI